MKQSELKQLIKEVIKENSLNNNDLSNIASECLSMLAHPHFHKLVESTMDTDPTLYQLYNDLYHQIKSYE